MINMPAEHHIIQLTDMISHFIKSIKLKKRHVDISDRYFLISSDGKNVTAAVNIKNLQKV